MAQGPDRHRRCFTHVSCRASSPRPRPISVRVNAGKTGFAANVERAARSDRALAVTSDNWDVDQFLLGTPEGTVDLKTGLLRPLHGLRTALQRPQRSRLPNLQPALCG